MIESEETTYSRNELAKKILNMVSNASDEEFIVLAHSLLGLNLKLEKGGMGDYFVEVKEEANSPQQNGDFH